MRDLREGGAQDHHRRWVLSLQLVNLIGMSTRQGTYLGLEVSIQSERNITRKEGVSTALTPRENDIGECNQS